MLTKIIAQPTNKSLTKADIQRNNTQNFAAWKSFIRQYGYRPRMVVVGAERALLSAEAYALEVKLGKWANHVSQQLKGHVPYAIDWQYPNRQSAGFLGWWNKTPTWQQKNNADNLKACQKFSACHACKPRQEISIEEHKLMKAEEYQNEIRLGNWIAHTAQTINNAEGSQRDWQYPEQQQAKFVKWYTQTPTGNQKQNADNLTAWKKFIVRYGYRPRQSISADARKKMTKTRYEQEVRLGKWANSVSQYLLPDWNQLVWQYQQQHDGFKELWQKTPTYNQKLNADKLILLQKFCRENGCRPSHDTSKKYPTIASAGEVSPEEDRLAVFVDTVRAGNSAFQYPEQYQAFEKCLSYPTRLAFQQKMDSRRFDRLATVP